MSSGEARVREHGHGVLGWLRGLSHGHHDEPAGSAGAVLANSDEGIRALKVSLLTLLLTAVVQMVVAVVSGSVALLADTVHNFSDALTAVPLWVAFALARRPASRRYTHGLGRAEDLAGVFILVMIALSAVVAGVESLRRLADPQPVTGIAWVLAAGLVGFAGNELVAVYRIRVGRRIGSAALVADGLHARADGFTSLAVVAGALGIALGFPLADPIVGLAITIAILFVLRGAAVEVYRRLMDGVDPATVDAAETALRDSPSVVAVDSLRLRWVGHQLRAEVRLGVEERLSLAEGHAAAHGAEDRLRAALPRLSEAIVHVRPAPAAGRAR